MQVRVSQLLIGSYAGLVIAVLGGALTMPELFFGHPHRGISFWGNYFPAVIPYVAGLAISVVCLLWVGRLLPDYPKRLSVLRRLLWALALGLAVILLTPEQVNAVFYWAHTFAAVYLFLAAGLGAVWIMTYPGKTSVDWILFWIMLAGSLLSLLSASYVRFLGVLALGQVLALNGASLLLVRAALRWSSHEIKE